MSKMLSKVVFIDELIYLIAEMVYRRGGHNLNDNYRKRSLLFNPFVINIVFIVIIIREIISLFITNEYLSQIIGDFSYKYQFKYQFKVIVFITYSTIIITEINNYYNFKNNKIHKTLETEGKQNLMNKKSQKYMKIIDKFIQIIGIYIGFTVSFGFSFYSFSLKYFIIFAIPWNILFCISFIYLTNIYSFFILYFIAFCLRSKLQISIENQRIERLIENKRLINNRNLLIIIRNIIKKFHLISNLNQIWSKYLLINFIFYMLLSGLLYCI